MALNVAELAAEDITTHEVIMRIVNADRLWIPPLDDIDEWMSQAAFLHRLLGAGDLVCLEPNVFAHTVKGRAKLIEAIAYL